MSSAIQPASMSSMPNSSSTSQSSVIRCGGLTRLEDVLSVCPITYADAEWNLPEGEALRKKTETFVSYDLWPPHKFSHPETGHLFYLTPCLRLSTRMQRSEAGSETILLPDASFFVDGTFQSDPHSSVAKAQRSISHALQRSLADLPLSLHANLQKHIQVRDLETASIVFGWMYECSVKDTRHTWQRDGWADEQVRPNGRTVRGGGDKVGPIDTLSSSSEGLIRHDASRYTSSIESV